MFIYSHNRGESVKALREGLGWKIIATKASKFKGSAKKTVLNWGASSLPAEVMKCNVINKPEAVAKAVNKISTFECFSKENVACVPWTVDQNKAEEWLKDGREAVVRDVINGYGGKGITIIKNVNQLKPAPLYTQYVPKTEEYRVHVINGSVVFFQRKARDRDVDDKDVNWKVRNKAGGFIFAHKDLVIPPEATKLAIEAVQALGLDFGSVDMIWNKTRNAYLVLEVNTASGLMGGNTRSLSEGF